MTSLLGVFGVLIGYIFGAIMAYLMIIKFNDMGF